MGTWTSTLSTWANTGDSDYNTWKTNLNNMRIWFTPGRLISKTEMGYLKGIIQDFFSHGHTYYDYIAVHEYGNTGSTDGPYTRTVFTTTTTPPTYDPPWTNETMILSSHYNFLRDLSSVAHDHSHQVTD